MTDTQYLLACLVGEAAEVGHAAATALRLGFHDPGGHIAIQVAHLKAVAEMLDLRCPGEMSEGAVMDQMTRELHERLANRKPAGGNP